VTAASCLDQLASDGSCVLVDIRTAREKEASGVPDVPSAGSARVIEVEYAFTEDRKLRGQLKDVGAIEATVRGRRRLPGCRPAAAAAAAARLWAVAGWRRSAARPLTVPPRAASLAQVTALQIANLKRLSKSSTLLLLDKNGGQAKAVAKALGARGFSKVFIVQGGFEGRGGWVQSKLQVKPVAGEPPGRPAVPHHAQHRSWLPPGCLVCSAPCIPGAPAPLPPARLPTAPAPLPCSPPRRRRHRRLQQRPLWHHRPHHEHPQEPALPQGVSGPASKHAGGPLAPPCSTRTRGVFRRPLAGLSWRGPARRAPRCGAPGSKWGRAWRAGMLLGAAR
jgi:rhodanese-related sulfurtransferase